MPKSFLTLTSILFRAGFFRFLAVFLQSLEVESWSVGYWKDGSGSSLWIDSSGGLFSLASRSGVPEDFGQAVVAEGVVKVPLPLAGGVFAQVEFAEGSLSLSSGVESLSEVLTGL